MNTDFHRYMEYVGACRAEELKRLAEAVEQHAIYRAQGAVAFSHKIVELLNETPETLDVIASKLRNTP